MPLRTLAADEFVRRLKQTSKDPDKRFAFFLGAGCSVSSDIPAAGALVREHWLPRLHGFQAPRQDFQAWIAGAFPEYDREAAGASYGAVMERLFLTAEERQREIETLCDGRFPGFGYATLANLVALPGGAFNVVLTTNFDDLLADALYLFTQARPLIIHHESLAGFIRPTRTRPLIVKLHGDNRLAPRNTVDETDRLEKEVQRQVTNLLHDRGLMFIGYSGNDVGIAEMMRALPDSALPLGVYWVNGEEPQGAIREWLESRNGIWVEKADFDEFMLLVRNEFDLPHPEQKRFVDVFERYKSTYQKLSSRIVSLSPGGPEADVLKEAVRQADKSFPSWYAVELEASRLADDPEAAHEVYRRGVEEFPNSAPLLSNYATFCENVLRDYDRAEDLHLRSIECDSEDAITLGDYASFLADVREDYEAAEQYFKRSFALDSDDADVRGNYARYLLSTGRKKEGLANLALAFELMDHDSSVGLEVELLFYAFAHDPDADRSDILRKLRSALEGGIRSSGWDFGPNLRQARREKNPDLEWLEKLADVISKKAELSILDDWAEWQVPS